jgi:hypothetical protein
VGAQLCVVSPAQASGNIGRTSRDHAIDQRLFSLEQKLFENFLYAVLLADQLVFEEIDKRALVPG